MANINGWGRGTWGQLTFGEALPVVVTGNVGTTALDNGTAVQAAAVTGVTATTSTSGLGDESVTCAANVAVTLDAITSALGNESLITNNFLDMTGLAGTSAVGSVTSEAKADIVLEGFELTAALNTVNVWGLVGAGVSTTYTIVSTTQTPDWQQVA
tara:strand:+ start:41 stop:508 length:468 start_codon:yes stop_codon:yes gene_type:complete